MNTKTKRVKKVSAVQRVKNVLAMNIQMWDEWEALTSKKVHGIVYDNHKLYITFEDGRWAGIKGDSISVTGTTGGYNHSALDAVWNLAEIGQITEAEAKLFTEWFWKQRKANEKTSEQNLMRELASKYGFSLVKKD
jgi:hypothetical protein